MKCTILILFCLFYLPLSQLNAQTSSSNSTVEYSPENILSYSRHLAKNNDFYRAHFELTRLQSFYPTYLTADAFTISNNYFLFKGEQYNLIISDDNQIKSRISKLFVFDAHLKLGNLNTINSMFPDDYYSLNTGIDDILFGDFYIKRKIISIMVHNEHTKVNALYAELQSEKYVKFKALTEIVSGKMLTRKSPLTAAFLGIMPGMGYVYSGQRSTGMVAFLFIAINAAATYFAYNTGNKSTALVIGSIGTFFYTGSIIGGYLQTKRYNSMIDNNNSQLLYDEFKLADDQEYIYKKYGIGYE